MQQLLTFYEQHIAKEVIYSQVRNLYDMSWLRTSFEQLNYKYEEHLDILHDLTQSEDFIRQGISKNKRGNISKSLHKGVVFEEAKHLRIRHHLQQHPFVQTVCVCCCWR